MKRTVANFAGTGWLEFGTDLATQALSIALAPAQRLYLSFFTRWANPLPTEQILLWKQSDTSALLSWKITQSLTSVSFTVSSNGTTETSMFLPGQLLFNDWVFVEAFYDVPQSIRGGRVQAASSTTLSPWTTASWTTPTFVSAGRLFVGAGPAGVNPFGAQMHSLVALARLPSDDEREFLFAEGNGRDYWEFPDDLKGVTLAYWGMEESSGTRADRAGSLPLLVAGGSVPSTTRDVGAAAWCHDAKPIADLAKIIANSYAFRDWVGGETLATVDQARARIFAHSDENPTLFPSAVIRPSESTINARRFGFPFGTLRVDFFDKVPSDGDLTANRIAFTNRTGKIREEMAVLGHEGGYLHLRGIAVERPVQITHPARAERLYTTRHAVEFGLEG